jgi:glutathione S-transferase
MVLDVSAHQATMLATVILGFKAFFTMMIQGGNRFKGGYRPPEDAALGLNKTLGKGRTQGFGIQEKPEKEADPEKLKKAQEIEARWARLVLNDLENIPIGLITAWGALQSPLFPKVHAALVLIFAAARVGHSYFYANAMQPHRARAWMVAVACMLLMGINGLIGCFMMY